MGASLFAPFANGLDVLVATPWFPNTREGWPARFVSDSAIALANAGARVRVGVMRGWLPPGLARWAGPEHRGRIDAANFPEIERIVTRRYFALPRGLVRPITNAALDTAVRAFLTTEIRVRRPDVIHIHTEGLAPSGTQTGRDHNVPVVVTLHGQNTNERYIKAPRQAQRFARALGEAERLVIVGEPLREFAAGLARRHEHIRVVWNGVTPPEATRTPPKPDTAPVELIAVSNLVEGKGLNFALAALGRVKAEGIQGWRLKIVGTGAQRTELEKQVSSEDLREHVTFVGSKSNAEVFNLLAQSDVFILPSFREAFGVAYLEAMSVGLLTIAVSGQGPSQFIEDGVTGLLIPPQDAEALADRLRTILCGDRAGWRRMAAKGALFARTKCTWNAHAHALLDILCEAAERADAVPRAAVRSRRRLAQAGL